MKPKFKKNWQYMNAFHKENSEACQKKVKEMMKHPLSQEEALAQEERRNKDKNIRIAKEAPLVQQLVKKFQTPLEFDEVIIIHHGLFYKQITLEMLSKGVLEEYSKTRQGKSYFKRLIEAYNETAYTVFNPAITIKVGKKNSALNKLLIKHDVEEWAYITPCNPYSKVLSDEENKQRYEELRKKIDGYKYFEGEGVGADSNWEPEKSFLILGISKEKAVELGNEYEQNAIVFGTVNNLSKLVILRQLM